MKAHLYVCASVLASVVSPITQSKAADFIRYDFEAVGPGVSTSPSWLPQQRFYDGKLVGNFTVDRSLISVNAAGDSVFKFSSPPASDSTSIKGLATQNELIFSYFAIFQGMADARLDLHIKFANGYLNALFPTAIDHSAIISSTVSSRISSKGTSNQFFGAPIYSLTADVVTSDDISSAAFRVVPEPGTWAMMIVGFGFVGAATRKHRSPTTYSAKFRDTTTLNYGQL